MEELDTDITCSEDSIDINSHTTELLLKNDTDDNVYNPHSGCYNIVDSLLEAGTDLEIVKSTHTHYVM